MRKLLLAFIFSVALTAISIAGDVSVVATVSSNQVALGSGLTYTITVTGAQGLSAPQMPPVDGFDVRYSGPSTRVSVVNGAYSAEQAFNYVFIPLKEGKFTIPAMTLDVNGQPFTTSPVDVQVVPQMASPSATDASGANIQQDLESRLRLQVSLAKAQVYMGEALPVTIRLYVNQLSLQELAYPEIVEDGFQVDAFSQPRQMNEVRDGVNWHVIEFSTNFYPSRPGEITVAPVVVRGNLVFKMEDQKDPRGGIFDDGFFSNFFSSYQKRAISMTSRPITLQVLPLPEEGRPTDFSGAVGQYDFIMDAAPLKVKAGDPVTLKMAVTGNGNLKAVKSPEFKAEGFKVYDPQVKDEPGRRLIEQVIVPTDVSLKQIPPMAFSYFDAQANAYRTITRGPIVIEVDPVATSEEFQAVAFAPVSALPETLGRDILFVKENPGKLEKKRSSAGHYWLFLIVLVVYLQVWAGLLAFYFYRRKLLLDPSFARQRKAARQALCMLDTAKAMLKDNNPKGFYDVLSKALNEYFVQRVRLVPGKSDAAVIDQILRDLKVEEKLLAQLEEIFASAEKARFAGIIESESKMRNHLADAEDIIRAVERRVR